MVLALLLATLPGLQDAPSPREVLSLSSRGIEALLADSKDQGLRQALALLPPRLEELGRELGAQLEVPPAALILAARALTRPVQLDVAIDPLATDLSMPFFARLELPAYNEDEARATARQIAQILRQADMRAKLGDGEGMVEVQNAPVSMWIGTQGTSSLLTIGAPEVSVRARAQTAGADASALSLSIDFGSLFEELGALAGATGTEHRARMSKLAAMGLLGRVALEARVEDHVSRARAVNVGYGRTVRASGMFPEGSLAASALAVVPEDALWAQLFAFDFGGDLDFVLDAVDEELAASGMQDPIEQLDQLTGFHVQRDFADHLGTTYGVYASETTGGSGITSVVGFASLRNAAALGESLQRLEESSIGMAQPGGGFAVRSWESGGTTFRTLTFPGRPIPVEPTWVIVADHLLVAASPQAALGAVQQLLHAETCLGDNPRFVEQFPSNREGLQAVGFLDSVRLLRAGYAPMSLVCSALANATRSSTDPAQDAGPILPSYHELTRGARAMVRVHRFEGDDMVQEALGDHSFVVNATALAGLLAETGLLPLLAAAGIGALSEEQTTLGLPGIESRLAEAYERKVKADLLMLHAALDEYAINNQMQYPESLQFLVEPDEHGRRYLASEVVPVDPWGREYVYSPPSGKRRCDLRTYGKDGVVGGAGQDRDLALETIRNGDF